MWKKHLVAAHTTVVLILASVPGCGGNDKFRAADAAPMAAEAGPADGLPAADAAKDASIPSAGTGTASTTTTGSASATVPDAGSGTGTGAGTGTGTGTASKTATGTGSATGTGTASNTTTGSGTGTGGTGIATGTATSRCEAPGLVWKTANKTEFTSYPAPGSEECIKYSGCLYEGMFAGCGPTMSLSWVQSHDIVSVFPDFATLKHHDLCLKAGPKTMVVLVIDTCADSDCSGCCTQNKGSASELIDVESFTAARFGVPDGPIQWADLGPTKGDDCPP